MVKRAFVLFSFWVGLGLLSGILSTACETTADRELQRAQSSLDKALQVGADEYATEDYFKAEQLLIQAQEYARQGKIMDARRAAVEAKIIADDAFNKAMERQKILEEESERLRK